MYSIIRNSYKLKCRSKFPLGLGMSTLSGDTNSKQTATKSSFDSFVLERQLQANRSVVVQVSSENSFPELYNYCKAFGHIVSAHHYCVRHDDVQHYILLEYENAQQANEAIDSSAYNEELSGVPARSPFLWFRASSSKAMKRAASNHKSLSLNIIDGNCICDNSELNKLLRSSPHIDSQMTELYEHTKLNDLGIRLRFLAAYQVQLAISGMFPLANALPFGSSVNGFGKMGCDLDLILRLDQECKGPEGKTKPESRLVFHTKENLTNGRSQTQRQMESIGDMLQLFLPGVCHVRRILQARVPIIKYHHEHLNLEIDLSMSNLSGFYMSELLYMYGEFDKRVRPLTFCIRRWAQSCGLTNPSPGRWISNFSLTCLVIFFLQQNKHHILPSVNALIKSASPADMRITEDGINCSFSRNLQQVKFSGKCNASISELLLHFFEFYSQFDFHNKGISLNEGRAIPKPDHSAMYIVNPLEQLLNVSKNVSLEECERLRIEVRNAAWMLETELENQHRMENEHSEESWGLLSLFKTPEKTVIRPNMFFRPRILEVSDLFEQPAPVSTTTANSVTSTTINLKNSQMKQHIESIKATGRQDLKQMRMNSSTKATPTSATPKTGTKRSR